MRDTELRRGSQMFAALSDPNRLRILELADGRELCVCELAPNVNLSQPTVSYHVNLLASAGLLVTRKQRTKVFCMTKRAVVKQLHRLMDLASAVETRRGTTPKLRIPSPTA